MRGPTVTPVVRKVLGPLGKVYQRCVSARFSTAEKNAREVLLWAAVPRIEGIRLHLYSSKGYTLGFLVENPEL